MQQHNYDAAQIEQKWQKYWQDERLYDLPTLAAEEKKEYVLVEWPYPSGNLHIGHWYAFAVPDIYVRYRRMTGVNVLYPMGFDAFGLPAENAAIKHKANPREWTEQNIKTMRIQLDSMGNAFSWNQTCSSTDPDYYKWTQWMFTKFFEAGLAYKGTAVVNWDPVDNTVVANEQVLPDGTSERSGAVVEKKEMPQWMIRITNYADRLIDDLEELNWPEHIKEGQRQWIGRSKGAELDFELSTGDVVTCFTTRPDTLYGATYLVLAPEHTLLTTLQSGIKNWATVADYIKNARQMEEQDRLDDTKEKTGVELEGVTAVNPANGESIPVYIADYVLAQYGTGAIMAVPAHDERDMAFAQKYGLEIRKVIAPDSSNLENEPETAYTGSGTLQNSGECDGMTSDEAKTVIINKFAGRWSNRYRLRDWSIGRQRYWGTPIPIVYDPDGNPHPVPEEHLPWTLPSDVDFTPTGEAPLAKSIELKERTEKIFGKGWLPEVETMDTFVDSSWYFLRYLDPTNTDAFATQTVQQTWMPVNIYFGGAEHTTMHLLYSRFWQKALYDLKLTPYSEPYQKRINHGMILGPDGNKMSKSKGNVVDPDEQVRLVGADTVKMYLAFMGPYEDSSYPWDPGGVAGIRRFLERVYRLPTQMTEAGNPEQTVLQTLHKTAHKIHTDLPQYKFNTAISALMVCVNALEREVFTKTELLFFLRLLAPFAPHLSEELWHQLGNETSIHSHMIPDADPALITDSEITLGVQINGKVRGTITIAPDASEETALNAVADQVVLQEKLEGRSITKVIYKPGRILNLLTK